jgi:hypothetical protein
VALVGEDELFVGVVVSLEQVLVVDSLGVLVGSAGPVVGQLAFVLQDDLLLGLQVGDLLL